MYTQRGTTKAHADNVFRAVLKAEGASKFTREVMWAAVVVGGGPAYRSNQLSQISEDLVLWWE